MSLRTFSAAMREMKVPSKKLPLKEMQHMFNDDYVQPPQSQEDAEAGYPEPEIEAEHRVEFPEFMARITQLSVLKYPEIGLTEGLASLVRRHLFRYGGLFKEDIPQARLDAEL